MLVEENSNFMGFMTDDDYNIRFCLVKTPEGGQEMLKPPEIRKLGEVHIHRA
jgi:hypothetical protein